MEAVRSALLDVGGVTRAQVALEGHEAIVTFDRHRATVEDLIAAVDRAPGPFDGIRYNASLKPAPRAGGSGR